MTDSEWQRNAQDKLIDHGWNRWDGAVWMNHEIGLKKPWTEALLDLIPEPPQADSPCEKCGGEMEETYQCTECGYVLGDE